MRSVEQVAFQGDLMIVRVDAIPDTAKAEELRVVAHSETGHHHIIEGRLVKVFRESPQICYLSLDAPGELVHQRPFDTHERLGLGKGKWQIRRQREWAPEGWRQVAD